MERRHGREVGQAPLSEGESRGDKADDEEDLQSRQGVLDAGAGLESAGMKEGENGDNDEGIELQHLLRSHEARKDARVGSRGKPGSGIGKSDGPRGDGAENPTKNETQPERNPRIGW